MLSGLVKKLPFRMNAKRVCSKMKMHKWQEKSNALKVNLPEYHGSNICLIVISILSLFFIFNFNCKKIYQMKIYFNLRWFFYLDDKYFYHHQMKHNF